MWAQARLAKEAGVSPTTISAIETGKIGRPHFGTIDKLALALRVEPEELLDWQESIEQQGPVALSLGWARETGAGEFEQGLEGASLKSQRALLSSVGFLLWAPSSHDGGSSQLWAQAPRASR
jgi:transcriptional regulator with XRE-family HTH domain